MTGAASFAGEVDWRGLMEPVARHFLGEPNKALSTKDILRWGTHGSTCTGCPST